MNKRMNLELWYFEDIVKKKVFKTVSSECLNFNSLIFENQRTNGPEEPGRITSIY